MGLRRDVGRPRVAGRRGSPCSKGSRTTPLSRDVDGDGLIEAVPTGNRGSSQAAQAEQLLVRRRQLRPQRRLRERADVPRLPLPGGPGDASSTASDKRARRTRTRPQRLKQAYAPALLNPRPAGSRCGEARTGSCTITPRPIINGYAIEYGLVDREKGREILHKLPRQDAKRSASPTCDSACPASSTPSARTITSSPPSAPRKQTDGRDTWQIYMNGGITAGHVYHFLAAHYVVGMNDRGRRPFSTPCSRPSNGRRVPKRRPGRATLKASTGENGTANRAATKASSRTTRDSCWPCSRGSPNSGLASPAAGRLTNTLLLTALGCHRSRRRWLAHRRPVRRSSSRLTGRFPSPESRRFQPLPHA